MGDTVNHTSIVPAQKTVKSQYFPETRAGKRRTVCGRGPGKVKFEEDGQERSSESPPGQRQWVSTGSMRC